jgi:hypothetical protein
MMSRTWMKFLPLCLMVALACGGPAASGPEPASPQAATTAQTSAAAPPAQSAKPEAPKAEAAPAPPATEDDSGNKSTVTLLDPGGEPRRKLRYLFSMKPESMILDMEMKMAMRMGDRVSPETELPGMRTVMRIVPKSISPGGDLSYEGVIVSNEITSKGALPAAARQKLEESLKSTRDMKVTSTVSSRGVVKEATMQIPDDAAPDIRQALESTRDALRAMCMPLPEEEVGVGARWKTEMNIKTTLRMTQTTTTTLKKLEPKKMELDVVLTQSAEPQLMTGPSVPPGTTIKLERMIGNGTGALAVKLDHPVPVSSVSVDNETTMTVSSGAQSMETGTRVRMVIKVKPGK